MTRQRDFTGMSRRPMGPWQATTCAMAVWALLWAVAGPASAAPSRSSEEEELAQAYGTKDFVSIATGSSQLVSRAPAVATVITADDIAAMGANDLDQVLESVPGLHVSRETQANAPVYVIRGVHLGFNPQVLMLINGIPITTVFAGNRGGGWGGYPVENISRIEVIRGPGSALYGADAFSGVINIITKTSSDIDGTQVGVRGGSFRTGDAWILHGGTWGALNVAAYLRVGTTDGARDIVQADAQTRNDFLTGTSVSLAPGPINNGRDFIDGSLDLSLDKWRWRVALKERRHVGTGVGVASALDPAGEVYSQNLSSDLSYEDRNFAPDWAVSAQLSYMRYKEFSDLVLLPPGAVLFPGGPVFEGGLIGNPDKWEQHGRIGASAFYTGFRTHRVRLGVGVEREEVYKVNETKNFDVGYNPIGTGSAADVIDVTATVPFIQPDGRTKHFAYVQDEWNFATDWTLTAGLRHDHYSDFGSTTNPRVALVWEAAYNMTAKLLYGSAFRAPSLSELYAINNPVVNGNPDLRPEKVKTLEAALSWLPVSSLQLGMNIFHYEASDIIRLVDFVYQNRGRQTGGGVEFEAGWDVSKALRLSGNYSYQRSIDKTHDGDAGNAPHHHVYLRADWRFTPGWALNTQLNWLDKRRRVDGDTRPSLAGYETVDVALRTDLPSSPWALTLSVRNLFDVDAREPSPFDGSPMRPTVSLPYDFPLPGRSVMVQATYQF